MSATNIQFVQRSGLLVLNVPGRATDEEFATIPDLIADKLGLPGTPPMSGVVVDLKDFSDMNEAAWQKLSAQLAKIPGRNKFFMVGVPAGMDKLIQGGSLALEVFGTIEDVFTRLSAKRSAAPKPAAEAAKPKTAEDEALEKLLIKTFQEAALKTLEVQCSIHFKAETPFLKNLKNKPIHDIAASMGLMSKEVSGTVALGFKESVFLKIMSKMLGEQYTSLSSEVEDGCGEFLNIIFGQAKKTLNDAGHQFGKTLPTIFIGQSLRVRQLTPNPAWILPFTSELGDMVLELGYRRT